VGVTAEADGGRPRAVTAEMYGDRDPGYGWTSRAVLEAGLCLALQVGLYMVHAMQRGTLQLPEAILGSPLRSANRCALLVTPLFRELCVWHLLVHHILQ